MPPVPPALSCPELADSSLGPLLEELTRRLQAGVPLDWPTLLVTHPQQAPALEKLAPILESLADLNTSWPELPRGPAGRGRDTETG